MLRTSACFVTVLACNLCGQKSQDEFFGLDRIWDIHIEVGRAEWVQMFPKRGRSETRMFGKFPYRSGTVTIGSHELPRVGIRMKGNATFMANGGTLKKSLKLDFNRFDAKRKFLGMGKLNLQCNALDDTQIKEAVSYHVYRSCGVVAGRTCFARVFLTLEGELKRSYIGLYTVVEQVDKRFAKRQLGGGLILKPDGETFAYLGATWNDDYENAYHSKSKVTEELVRPLIRTAALFDEPSDVAFAKGIEAVMDVERFLEYTAASAILINTDSPLTIPDNYYLIVSKRSKKVTIVPWDMNWSMGEYGRVTGTPTVDLSVMMPTRKEVFRRILEIPRFEKRYREIATRFIDGPCSAETMSAAIRRAHETVKGALAEETTRDKSVTQAAAELGGRASRHPMLRGRSDDDVNGLLAFAKAREQSVKRQLAGESKGRPARNLWGPNARTVRGSHVRDVFSGVGAFRASGKDFDRNAIDAAIVLSFSRVDSDGSKTIQKNELTTILRRRWSAEPRRRRGRRDPSADRARQAMSHLDTDADGSVGPEEWKVGVTGLLRYWDRDIDGHWSRDELNLTAKKSP
jgi:CotH kinase protein